MCTLHGTNFPVNDLSHKGSAGLMVDEVVARLYIGISAVASRRLQVSDVQAYQWVVLDSRVFCLEVRFVFRDSGFAKRDKRGRFEGLILFNPLLLRFTHIFHDNEELLLPARFFFRPGKILVYADKILDFFLHIGF